MKNLAILFLISIFCMIVSCQTQENCPNYGQVEKKQFSS